MIYVALILLGLAFGSFTNALVWRIHEQESLKKKKNPNKEKLRELSISKGRSMCPHCEHTLVWYDLVPVVSWLSLGGKCRYCKKPISWQYPLVEVLAAVSFALSYYFWPQEITTIFGAFAFGAWLLVVIIFIALTIYDLRWMQLPNRLIYPLYVAVVAFRLLQVAATSPTATGWLAEVTASIAGALVLGGLFWIIYQVSNGTWIGGGDVRLGFALGILLGWQKALLNLAFAAYLGSAVILVLVLIGKYHKKLKLPFGPFLITAAVVCMLWGQVFIDWYKRLSGL